MRRAWLRAVGLTIILLGSAACGKSPEQRVDDARAAMAQKDYASAVVELRYSPSSP